MNARFRWSAAFATAPVHAFVISGRPENARAATTACLNRLGISGGSGLVLKQPGQDLLTVGTFKSAARRMIERRGFLVLKPMCFLP